MPGVRRQRDRRARHRRRKDRLHGQDVHAERPCRHEKPPRCLQPARQPQPRQDAAHGRRVRDGAKAPGAKSRTLTITMAYASNSLPIKDTLSPSSQDELGAAVREAFDSGVPLYSIGGGTSLDLGLPAKTQGRALSLAKLDRIVDYPARDMTVTIEA